MSRDLRGFLEDIRESIGWILQDTCDMSLDTFTANRTVRDAVLLRFIVIGEAAKNIPEEIRRMEPKVPWRQICGMRDRITHAYFDVDEVAIWEAIQQDLPTLFEDIGRILAGIDLERPDAPSSSILD